MAKIMDGSGKMVGSVTKSGEVVSADSGLQEYADRIKDLGGVPAMVAGPSTDKKIVDGVQIVPPTHNNYLDAMEEYLLPGGFDVVR